MSLDDPTRLEATATCENQAPSAFQTRRVAESPNGRFVATNAALFDRQTQRGVCFDVGNPAHSASITVDDHGTVRHLDRMYQQGSGIQVGRIANGAIDPTPKSRGRQTPKGGRG
ncbi:hypothetical protein JT358_03530 [Micrococcales bacterium 31B]|nr:hypothetical protein [Micrococcales bacterium 31B]